VAVLQGEGMMDPELLARIRFALTASFRFISMGGRASGWWVTWAPARRRPDAPTDLLRAL